MSVYLYKKKKGEKKEIHLPAVTMRDVIKKIPNN